jgi:UDP-glucose 4-epimerase
MRVLVTGGAGFIGSHLTDALVAAGHAVTVVDDLSAGRREQVPPGATLVAMDILDPALGALLAETAPEAVFHLAAHASVSESVREPEHDARVNVLGTLNLLRACADAGVRRFVFSSTGGALYGEPRTLPCDEHHPVRPLSPYGASKAGAEAYVHALTAQAGMDAVILRYANVYGPRQDPDGEAGVVAIFAARMLAGELVTVFGGGEQQRDFVYVADVVDANLRALRAGEGGVYNIGTGVGTSVNELFAALAAATGYARTSLHAPPRPGDVGRIWLDASAARAELGWESTTALVPGIEATVESLRTGRAR